MQLFMCEGVWPNGKGVFWPWGDIEFKSPFTNLYLLLNFLVFTKLKIEPKGQPYNYPRYQRINWLIFTKLKIEPKYQPYLSLKNVFKN